MYGSSWMLFRGFGAMNGLRGGAGPPSTGFGVAVAPSKLGTDERWGSGIGTAGTPGVCAAASAGHAGSASAVSAAISPARAPQPLCRIARRAYARLLLHGPEAARADPGSELPHQPLHAGVPGRRQRRPDLLQRGGRCSARDLIRGVGADGGEGLGAPPRALR